MRPVAVAILATLLPLCLLVIGLIRLLIILCIKLRVLRAEYKELQAQKLATTDELPKAEEQEPWSPAPYVIKEESHLSDVSNPDWDIDTHATISYWIPRYDPSSHPEVPSESRNTLRYWPSYRDLYYACQNKSEQQAGKSLLPFSPEIQKDLQNFFTALERIKFSPEFSRSLLKFPCQLASEYGNVNEENLEKFIVHLEDLFRPLVREESLGPDGSYRPFLRNTMRSHMTDAITLRLRMLGSRQQFEFRWDDATETSFCALPALYSHAGSDGVPLDKPKLWKESITMVFKENEWRSCTGGKPR